MACVVTFHYIGHMAWYTTSKMSTKIYTPIHISNRYVSVCSGGVWLSVQVRWVQRYTHLYFSNSMCRFVREGLLLPSVWLTSLSRLGPPYMLTLSELMFGCLHIGDVSCMNECKTNHFVTIWLHPSVCRKLPYAVSQGHRSLRSIQTQAPNQALSLPFFVCRLYLFPSW